LGSRRGGIAGKIRPLMSQELGFFQRLVLAFVAFFYVLANRGFAARVRELRERERLRASLPPNERTSARAPASQAEPPPPADRAEAAPPAARREVAMVAARPEGAEALHLLSLLQRDGRLVDFLAEDLTGFSDAEIGAAARTVHEGCKKVMSDYLTLEPVLRESEGASVALAAGFDPAAIRLTGNVVGDPPFRGTVRHHGWRAAEVRIPEPPPGIGRVVAPAEVEL
jgi:hypothetical protein